MSFVDRNGKRYAIDLKTTYRKSETECNGFTLGSHGKYFQERESTKNIQFPYWSYEWHYCLWIIYDKVSLPIDETKTYSIDDIGHIESVISNFTFFAQEKWKIASDKGWSWNTANIWSITNIDKILSGDWVFALLGEDIFDNYWINYWIMRVPDAKNPKNTKKLTTIEEFITHTKWDHSLINK